MNLFIRYFSHETLAHNVNEAIEFLGTINEIKLDGTVPGRISNFLYSNNTFPFRLKVSYSNYVLFLKTEAETLEEFHILEQKAKEEKAEGKGQSLADKKRSIMEALNESHSGWYEGNITFKRVTVDKVTNKCKYIDTQFSVRCKAQSAMHCYERIIDHLKSRPEIDPRSQYPSVRSNNFTFKFLGE
ncbi:MAG: hypothetical protein IJV06_05640 [Bacteroidaceae bacterium]|nr:hypothetical protein [Bacteroidaceae bacterium]